MEFRAFADRAAAIESLAADLEICEAVTDLLAEAEAETLTILARFVQGRVFPAWSSRTLDVGPRLCYEALARAAGPNVTADTIEERLADAGDVGEVAANLDLGGQRGLDAFADGGGGAATLTVREVFEELDSLASSAGSGSQDHKLDRLYGLFTRCDPIEARYLARLVLGEMRIGVGSGTVRDAIAAAFDVPVEAVERALQVSNDYGLVARTARESGIAGVESIDLELGRPVQAMLAQSGTIEDALSAWETAVVETKYDGARVQIHHDPTAADPVSIYSRNMESVTDALPDVVETIESALSVPAILDGEVVAVDDDGDPLPFQEVLRRFRRKHDVARAREDVAVVFHPFDCLHADGEDLIAAPLTRRRDRLGAIVEECHLGDGVVAVGGTRTEDPTAIERASRAAIEAGHEGVVLKDPDSAYTPGRRGREWLKLKPTVETLDLVVTGAEWGEGRRAALLGTYEVSVRTETGYATVGNVATGVTDEELADLTERLEPHVVATEGQTVDVEPAVVFEVGYEELQRSPSTDSGYALRFPRFVGVRDDLDPDDADTLERVERLAEDG
jgi:DNA ligase-1